MTKVNGFTLLECLVALVILAVALSAVLRASGSAQLTTAQLQQQNLASWVAQNRLAELRAHNAWPAVGNNEGEEQQAGTLFHWREKIDYTPNPLFRRVDIQVFDETNAIPLASMSGYVVRPLHGHVMRPSQ